MSDLDRLTDNEAVIRALDRAGVIYARRNHLDVPTLSRAIVAIVAVEGAGKTLPPWAISDAAPDPARDGPLARKALEAMLNSPPEEGLRGAAAEAISHELAGRAYVIDPLTITCATLLALAVLSKWSWSKDKGHQFASGFPDLDKVLEKVGAILDKVSALSPSS